MKEDTPTISPRHLIAEARRQVGLTPPRRKKGSVDRLTHEELEVLLQAAYGASGLMVGSGPGAPVLRIRWIVRRFRSGPQSGFRDYVSRPRRLKPSVRFSRTRLSCWLRPTVCGPLESGSAFHRTFCLDAVKTAQQGVQYRFTPPLPSQ